ncbi:hypothetical protein GW846_01690 [Candidatus Gracilibacteria bacterium]|nr:hypothetical protein [Candidatus Gracilibacteria bacterium]
MIHVKSEDTIIDIVEKIQAQQNGDIVLDFPLGHPILHNYISLKILKSKVGDRKLIIATNDRIGRKIGKQLGIEYSVIKDSAFIKQSTGDKLMQHNFTFIEYLKFQLKSYFTELKHSFESNKKLNSLGKYSRIYNEKTGVGLFLGAFLISLLLFVFIYYFAVSKTYIYITPEVSVKKEAYNFIFNENDDNVILGNNKYIKIKNVVKSVDIQETYTSSEIKNNSNDVSAGSIQFYNETTDAITLIKGTRVRTESGVVFTLDAEVTIPAALTDNFGENSPGISEGSVTSKSKDEAGVYVGTRGNISTDTSLTIPGLEAELQKLIYAKTIEDFTGGIDDFETVVSQEDIDNAILLFGAKLKSEVLRTLKNSIAEENEINNTQIDILSGGKSIRYGEATITVLEDVQAGDVRDNFVLKGNIEIQAYTYNRESVIQKLKTLLSERNLEGVEKISLVDSSSLRMSEIISSQTNPFQMKATFEIEALLLHDFLHTQNKYIEQLKSKVQGLQRKEATKTLINDPKIRNVEIKIRPFFIDSVSKIQNNIIFEVR